MEVWGCASIKELLKSGNSSNLCVYVPMHMFTSRSGILSYMMKYLQIKVYNI